MGQHRPVSQMERSATAASTPLPAATRNAYGPAEEPHALSSFLRRHAEFDASRLDRLRATEYGRLDAQGQVYLDYTGGGLYAESQLSDHLDLLAAHGARQPALHQPDLRGDDRAGRARAHGGAALLQRVADEYCVVFTPNATGALKLVGEAYPFEPGSRFLLTSDNHNSVNGMREFARASGATTTYLPSTPPSLRVDDGQLEAAPARRQTAARNNLFAFPAQSNFSGVQHPLDWIADGTVAPAGTCSWTARRSCRRTGSTSASGSRTSSASRSTSSSGTRPASAACSFATRPWPGCVGPGSPAAPSPP